MDISFTDIGQWVGLGAIATRLFWPKKAPKIEAAVQVVEKVVEVVKPNLCRTKTFRFANGPEKTFHTGPNCPDRNTDKPFEAITNDFMPKTDNNPLVFVHESTHLVGS